MKVHNFRDLIVWQKGMEVSKTTYIMTSTFPADEKYGLKSQMQRSAISIPSNIAEGCGRTGNNELKHFLTISLGSSYELETQIILANEFGYINNDDLNKIIKQIQEVQKMLVGLYKSLS
ncbi:MAG: four helix bundle protein [Bacteroidetes bacterium]|jgi:four helix bundle protein|nr:four helix bundle protein [Bacteroidota bacterium]HMT36385.1 four helix bundle protein [Chitinophagaceae bacterium]MBK6820458.1 four helix bundle protein [Bacteroidota bacterium]MBK7041021.1 four helix bundle protein [Bacteroidota bacterium]MBK8328894.1 four helix bundle protein [Bacteroidota bacterium]